MSKFAPIYCINVKTDAPKNITIKKSDRRGGRE